MKIEIEPVGFVEAVRSRVEDDFWGGAQARISLTDKFTSAALQGLPEFSHAEIVFQFHSVDPANIVMGARHPRGNKAWPLVGIFAQRGKDRPNRIGCTICQVVRVESTKLYVAELDALDGTPVLDIKPVMQEFLPREEVRQPEWSRELMRDYWLSKS